MKGPLTIYHSRNTLVETVNMSFSHCVVHFLSAESTRLAQQLIVQDFTRAIGAYLYHHYCRLENEFYAYIRPLQLSESANEDVPETPGPPLTNI